MPLGFDRVALIRFLVTEPVLADGHHPWMVAAARSSYAMAEYLTDGAGRVRYMADDPFGTLMISYDLRYLEFLANEFKVNPRPRLMLLVEGNGEFEQFPRLAAELFGVRLSKLRIGLINLQGVEGFTGRKRADPYGALEKLIDHYHYLQTIVFVVLDDEARVGTIKQRLIGARSKFYPNRMVTKDEYIRLWQKNVEFDNFTHAEIAQGMTAVADGAYVFTEAEIADCEQRFGREGDTLSKLYRAKISHDLVKPELLKILFDYAIAEPEMVAGDRRVTRPVVEVIDTVIDLAIHNHPPSYLDAWEQTQNSDWLGAPPPKATP